MGEIRASADESEPLVVTCVKMCMVQRKMELRERVKDGQNDDKGDLKLLPCSKKSKAEDGSSRAHAACFEALINAGADVDQWDGEGLAPIHHAAKNGDAGCVRFLCGLDADADQFVCDERRVRPLHLAAAVSDRRRSLRTCIALLESGCDAQCADYEGRTCLHVVAERGPRGLVELLMDAGCSKEAEDVHGRKPADAAEAAGQAKIAELIRGYKDPVLKVGGSVGISKRMEFLETGQLELDGVGADRGGGGALRASAKKLRKDLFAKLKGKKKYKAGMTKPKKPPVLPEIRFPSDAETYKPWVRYVSEAGEPYWSCSSVLCVVSPAARRCDRAIAARLPLRHAVAATRTHRRRHRRHNPETDASTWDEPPKYIPAPKGEARVTSAEKRARAQAKKAKRQAHRRRLAAAPTVGDEPALMDAPSPIATTPGVSRRRASTSMAMEVSPCRRRWGGGGWGGSGGA